MSDNHWVCPWGICNAEQAQQCRAELHPRKGCGGRFPNMNAEQAMREVQPRIGCAQCNALQSTLLQVQGERDRIRQETIEKVEAICKEHMVWCLGTGYPEKARTIATIMDRIRALGEKP